MTIVLWAFGAFAVMLVAQVVVWRVVRPVRQYALLMGLCLAVLGTVLLASRRSGAGGLVPFVTATDYVTFTQLYLSLAAAYIATYPAAQAESPSLVILLKIHAAGARGLRFDDLQQQLTDQFLVIDRLEDLLVHGLAVQTVNRYVITKRGALLASVHVFYRTLLKMEKGG